jgi:hypothetical protein
MPDSYLSFLERHPFMPKFPSSGNKKAVKPDVQRDLVDYQLLDPAACPYMQPFLSLLYK